MEKFDLRKEFNRFRYIPNLSVFLEYENEVCYTYTLYLNKIELVSITFNKPVGNDKKFMVYVNSPYYENGKDTFQVRTEETDKQYIFLETDSEKVAFNLVQRIVSNKRYPKPCLIW